MPARSVNNFVFAQPPELVVESSEDYLDAAEDKMYGYSTKENEEDVKRFYSNSDDSLGEDTHTYSSSYSSGSKDPVSINFGFHSGPENLKKVQAKKLVKSIFSL